MQHSIVDPSRCTGLSRAMSNLIVEAVAKKALSVEDIIPSLKAFAALREDPMSSLS